MYGGLIYGRPVPLPGVVTKQSRLSVPLFLDGSGGELKVAHVFDHGVGEHYPELVLDELCHFFPEEVGVLVSGVMATSADAVVFLVDSPRCGVGFSGNAMVSPLSEEWDRRMIGVIKVG